MNSLERELGVARDAALAGGEVIVRHTEGDRRSWEKAEDSPVTQADLEANQAILQIIQDAFPEDAILSEETKDHRDRQQFERVWIVDPLDGTKEFVARIPEFAVSVALAIGGEPAVGVVYQPLDRECFVARRGAGAELNGESLSLSPAAGLDQCVVLSSRTEMSRGQMEPFEGWFQELRPIGSVALKLAWIAAGRGDLWISTAPKNEWDVCAGDLLVREAGGEFVTLEAGKRVYNQPDTLLRPLMAAGAPGLVEAFRQRSRHL